MGELFSSPPKVKTPEAQPVLQPPEVTAEETQTYKRRHGRADTIITGELEPITKKKTLLG